MDKTLPHIYPDLKRWQMEKLPQFASAVYASDFEIIDQIEESLKTIAVRIEERARTLASIKRKSRVLFTDELDEMLEEYFIDVNKSIENIQSIRTPGAECPIRKLMSLAISELKTCGGIRLI